MEHFADLHVHTYYSDGWKSPEEVVGEAVRRKLKVIAITDHDNMRSYPLAEAAAQDHALELIPGVELTTRWSDHNGWSASVDLLGYGVNPADEAFQALLRGALADTTARIGAACATITALGYPVRLEDVYHQNEHFAGAGPLVFALIEKGYVPNFAAGLDLFRTAWEEVSPPALAIDEAIGAIHKAGGVAVLAHPTRVPLNDGRMTVEQLHPLVEAGLDGIEVCHPNLNARARTYYRVLAEGFDLLTTGGSDEHAFGGNFSRMGAEPVTRSMVDHLRQRLNAYRHVDEES